MASCSRYRPNRGSRLSDATGGSIVAMATTKRSISFDRDVLEAAERAADAEPYGGNLSGLVNDALDRHLKLSNLRELLDDLDRELGPVPETVRKRVDREWPD